MRPRAVASIAFARTLKFKQSRHLHRATVGIILCVIYLEGVALDADFSLGLAPKAKPVKPFPSLDGKAKSNLNFALNLGAI